jgi:hypothetical protein
MSNLTNRTNSTPNPNHSVNASPSPNEFSSNSNSNASALRLQLETDAALSAHGEEGMIIENRHNRYWVHNQQAR